MEDDSATIARIFLRLGLAAAALVLLIIDLIWACLDGTLPLVLAVGLVGVVASLLTVPERNKGEKSTRQTIPEVREETVREAVDRYGIEISRPAINEPEWERRKQ